ncbi:acyl-CoA thioesterase [Pseudoflavitalea rhizosphaerae]|uniref:acyl-CoA thioesterase n=1 Tax=Pseudoflavitalea rhizosphaerae TaxID=1884793 RepID=UPI000F8C5345|nr:hotdog domain-containing protein [Pseudoflavitalea rhizosphaerae]
MTFEERIAQAETRVTKAVFPDTMNHHNTMFGGRVIMMMTETAFMTATRFSRKTFVMVSSGQIDFKKPIPAGTMVELVGNVHKVGNTSIQVQVDVFLEHLHQDGREKVVSGIITFVALDENSKPTPILG